MELLIILVFAGGLIWLLSSATKKPSGTEHEPEANPASPENTNQHDQS